MNTASISPSQVMTHLRELSLQVATGDVCGESGRVDRTTSSSTTTYLIPQNSQAYLASAIDTGMVDLGGELELEARQLKRYAHSGGVSTSGALKGKSSEKLISKANLPPLYGVPL